MTAPDDPRWRAIESRDPRFDGRFFTGVVTTGIYCRPICPAKTPRRENVRIFACAAAAESEGFRPCRRCRPETAPGSPAWLGTSSTVSRALRLIEDGALDSAGVDALAARLGIGDRHLRRLFDEHVGASPIAVAGTRRVHFARLLLDSSGLSIAAIAAAAGFASTRRFQTAFRATFGRSASSVRARRPARTPETARSERRRHDGLTLHLPWRAPYDVEATLAFLAGRAIPGVEAVVDGAWRRTFVAGRRVGALEARPDPSRGAIVLRATPIPGGELAGVVRRVRALFDVGANAARIADHLSGDEVLAPSVRERPGLRVPTAWDPFEACVRAIVGQQISVKGATTILGRLAARCGRRVPAGGALGAVGAGLTHAFPAPAALAGADLEGLGLPRARAATLRELAARGSRGAIRFDASASFDEIESALLSIPGIGPWTVKYVRMRGLGDPDVFLEEDLGVRRALTPARGRAPSAREAAARAQAWSPWRSYAVVHLWAGGVSTKE